MSKHGKSVISKQGKLQIVICSNLIIKKTHTLPAMVKEKEMF